MKYFELCQVCEGQGCEICYWEGEVEREPTFREQEWADKFRPEYCNDEE